jgi:predicted DCC family thiol-disulfide oxidoreductase YuxK
MIIVFYDGCCPFCIGWINWLLKKDRHGRLRFASLQNDWTAGFLDRKQLQHPGMDSMAVWDGSALQLRSAAALTIVRSLPAPWKWLTFMRYIPTSLRDGVYNRIAAHRHRWPLSRSSACILPTPDQLNRFLDTH